MARQAVEAFRRQTYDPTRRMLLILDTGDLSWYDGRCDAENELHVEPIRAGETIGELRNYAATFAESGDIIVHWDDDDLSHPNRIAEQVALLQSSGADAVGYRQMLFWREPMNGVPGTNGEAWVYTRSDLRYVAVLLVASNVGG